MNLRPTAALALTSLVCVGCGSTTSSDNASIDELRAIKQQQLDMVNQVVKIYDEDLSYEEVQDRKSEVMSKHDETRKKVKALREKIPKAEFDTIQQQFEAQIQAAKQRERDAAKAWGDRMRNK